LYKPVPINRTSFWDVSFDAGRGFIPTLVSTTGVLGILSWLVFLGLFIFTGIKFFYSGVKNSAHLDVTTLLFFLMALYLFVASIFYFIGMVLFLLAMVFAGVFIGLAHSAKSKGEISFSFFDDHRKSFFFMLFLILMIIVSVVAGFKYIQRFISVIYFTKTISAGSIEGAESYIGKTLALNSNDLYLRTYSQVYITKLGSIISRTREAAVSEEEKATLQNTLDQAVGGAQAAINYNPNNYLNFEMLGNVFQTAGLIGVKDAYANALTAYGQASALNPVNPRINLILSNISFVDGKTKEAKDYADKALSLKPDYIDGLITMSRIAKSQGNNAEALSYAEKALSLLPTNKDLIRYVESLK